MLGAADRKNILHRQSYPPQYSPIGLDNSLLNIFFSSVIYNLFIHLGSQERFHVLNKGGECKGLRKDGVPQRSQLRAEL